MALTAYQQTTFWSRQFSEHLQFLSLLFTDPALKSEAIALGAQYNAARRAALSSMNEAQVVATIMPMHKVVYEYQQAALERLVAGEFLGWAFPLFVSHITHEMELYAFLVGEGPEVPGGVDDTVKQLGAEHALFAAHLLDPSQEDQIKGAREAAALLYSTVGNPDRNEGAANVEQTIAQFLIDEKIGLPGGALSIIPISLSKHVVREQYYFVRALREGV